MVLRVARSYRARLNDSNGRLYDLLRISCNKRVSVSDTIDALRDVGPTKGGVIFTPGSKYMGKRFHCGYELKPVVAAKV